MTAAKPLKVTLDSDILVAHRFNRVEINKLIDEHKLDVGIVSVTKREMGNTFPKIKKVKNITETMVFGETNWGEGDWGGDEADEIPEAFVMGESGLGTRLGPKDSKDRLENILQIISNGAFPKKGERSELEKGERSQLRDAMILEAHIRSKREIFVSNDKSAFGRDANDSKRLKLQETFNVRIMNLDEFLAHLQSRLNAPNSTNS